MPGADYVKAAKIRAFKAQGLNQKQIAKELGCHQTSISAISRNHGIIWPKGAAARNQNGSNNPAFKDGLAKSTIERLTRKVLSEAGKDLTKCERCGYQDFTKQELPRHHKDRDRSNNAASNLEVLCWGCHNQEHMNERTRDNLGKFSS